VPIGDGGFNAKKMPAEKLWARAARPQGELNASFPLCGNAGGPPAPQVVFHSRAPREGEMKCCQSTNGKTPVPFGPGVFFQLLASSLC
jgi:hypothetical protein